MTSTLTQLSPAAWSILAAATQRIYNLDPEDAPLSASEYGSVIAAALRATANHGENLYDPEEGKVAVVRDDFLQDIAAELDTL